MGYAKLKRLVNLDGSAALQYKISDPDVQDDIDFLLKNIDYSIK